MSTIRQTEPAQSGAVQTIPMGSAANDAAVKVTGLSRKFGSSTVVDRLTMEVGQGQFLGLIGANGAGKSTTLKMLAGMLEQTAGSGEVLGTPIEQIVCDTFIQR